MGDAHSDWVARDERVVWHGFTQMSVFADNAPIIVDRAVEVLVADERVRALWVHGSVGRGEADASSDLDLILAVADDAFDEVWAAWPEWLAAITPTVLARPLPWIPGILYALTPECLRIDVVVERIGNLPSSGFGRRALVFDRDGLDALVPPPPTPPGPDRTAVETAIEEPLRYLSLLPAVLDRQAYLLSQEGYAHIRRRLVELFQQANAPQATVGMKHGRYQVTDEQYAVLEALPWPQATREELIAAHRAIGSCLLEIAPPIAALVDLPWPQALEDAVRAHLRRELGIDLDGSTGTDQNWKPGSVLPPTS
ncbi:MAG TPA: nucleotidyltransferase domain-containing protein [Acidimicrobiales bacterium]